MTKRKLRGISRIDSDAKNMHGWFVRVYLSGKVYANKYFSDLKYGGKRKALHAAVEYRDEKTKERNEAYPDAKYYRRRITRDSRNKTGIIGISRTTSRNRSGSISESYQVTWRPRPNVVKSRSFSIKKYGEAGALWRAWKVRREVEIKLFGEAQTPDFERFQRNILSKMKKVPDFSNLFIQSKDF
ncbi:MAG: hypothetical protein GXO92_04420 [FCB group bacterium]|nr:hypothetical protein [FCB group bacterium]